MSLHFRVFFGGGEAERPDNMSSELMWKQLLASQNIRWYGGKAMQEGTHGDIGI